MAEFKTAIFYDDNLRVVAKAAGRNYWPIYYREILNRMGLPYTLIGPGQLSAPNLEQYSAVLLPPLPVDYLDQADVEALSEWVTKGGLLLGFATPGLDELFGISVEETLAQLGDEFTASACIRLCDKEFDVDLLMPEQKGMPLPVLAEMQRISASGCRELARLFSFFEEDLHHPAITYRAVGDGAACYWTFDLAQCAWAMHQGRPVWDDYDGDGRVSTRDMIATRPWNAEVPYADLMMFTLRRIIGEHGGVFLYQLPPTEDGAIPDALFHWGGDDEATDPPDIQIPAAEFMVKLGLPYHINIMQQPVGRHPMPVEMFNRLKELGCECSIHPNMYNIDNEPGKSRTFTKEDLADQLDVYKQTYGEIPVCTVFHSGLWTGWADTARWLAELGMKGDNNRFARRYPPSNPVNTVAFPFGTSYPFHYYDDYTHDNRRLEFTSQPITAYECGYLGGVDGTTTEFTQLHRAIKFAKFWNLTMNMFYHPSPIAKTEATQEAIREVLRYIKKMGMTAVHLGTDGLCLWWHSRAASRIGYIERNENQVVVKTHTDYPGGCIIQLLVPRDDLTAVEVNGKAARYAIREQHNARWLYIMVPSGKSVATIN